MSSDTSAQHTAGKADIASIVVALLLVALAAIISWDGSQLKNTNPYGLGPNAMSYVVAVGLCILAIGNFVNAFRGGLPEREHADYRPVLLILAGLAGLIGVIGIGGGFIIATAILFITTSTAFGRRAYLADTIIGFVLATLIYFAFDRILSLSLPAGPLERLF